MGKKSKTNTKLSKATPQNLTSEPINHNLAELSLEQFEKSLTAMLETLNTKRLEFLKATALDTLSPYNNDLPKSPERDVEEYRLNQSTTNVVIPKSETPWNIHKQAPIDESTASSGSLDSSQTFMFPRSSHKMKEMALKRSTVESSWTLNRTPLSFINKGWRRTLRTPDSLIKTDLRGSENKRGFPYSKGNVRKDYGCLSNMNTTDCLTNFVLHELSYNGSRKTGEVLRVKSFSDLVQKRSDMYVKNKKYYALGELSLEDILHRIYFEKYSYNDLRDYIPLALRKITDVETFLDTLYDSIREFSLVVIQQRFIFTKLVREQEIIFFMKLLDVVIRMKRIVKEDNGEMQVVHEFGGYKRFGKYALVYTNLINKVYEACKSLEVVASEVEKVCWVSLRSFLKEERKFCCIEFHRQIFVKYFYNEPLIKDFIASITRYFDERQFYASNYPTTARQLQELNEFFNRWQFSSSEQTPQNNGNLSEAYSVEPNPKDSVAYKVDKEIIEGDYQFIVRDLQKEYKSMQKQETAFETLRDATNEEMIEQCSTTDQTKSDTKSKQKKTKKKKKQNKKANLENKENENQGNLTMEPCHNESESTVECHEEILFNEENEEEPEECPKFDDEVKAFAWKLEHEKLPGSSNKKIKPNISDKWIESLKNKLQKKRTSFN